MASFGALSYQSLISHQIRNNRNAIGWRFRVRVRVSDGGGGDSSSSYLDMWKKAVERERKSTELQKIVEKIDIDNGGFDGGISELEKKSAEFQKILEVPREERDRIQHLQVIDRAAAAIAAAHALVKESGNSEMGKVGVEKDRGWISHDQMKESQSGIVFLPASNSSGNGTPGPDFWSWEPPSDDDGNFGNSVLQPARKTSPSPVNPVMEKERSIDSVALPFERVFLNGKINHTLPPLQSLVEVEKEESASAISEVPSFKEDNELDNLSSAHAAEAAHALEEMNELASHGINLDGSRWWKERGIERRPDGVICRWTMKRGVCANQVTEWQEKFWEASDDFGYKELASEKSGRDATGNVWREYWRESMWQDSGLLHLEKTADKWGKNGKGGQWQEQWWEHYNAAGQAEKWAHKWCSIDPMTELEAGHAHVWHERWGEKYDGHGGIIKYTDKWAERCEGDGWSKWGDKWDENFDPNGHGVKQGQTWGQGKNGERWNKTWGEEHNGSGWVHKYGKSSSGEHWDTHIQQDTWYERFPHYGFYHCFDNSIQLREVQRPSEMS